MYIEDGENMEYFVFYEYALIKGKGMSMDSDTIHEWIVEGAKQVSYDYYNSIDISKYRYLEIVRYRIELGKCPHCNSDFKNAECWILEHEMNGKQICGNCQIGIVPVCRILTIKTMGQGKYIG